MPPKKKRKVVPAKSPAVSNKGIVACFLQGSTTLRLAHKPGPEIRFFRAKLEGFYSAQTAQDSLECSTTMGSGFMDCAGARRENRRPLEYQRGQPAGSVWVHTGAPAAPGPNLPAPQYDLFCDRYMYRSCTYARALFAVVFSGAE